MNEKICLFIELFFSNNSTFFGFILFSDLTMRIYRQYGTDLKRQKSFNLYNSIHYIIKLKTDHTIKYLVKDEK